MIAADTSVVAAAALPWQEGHAAAVASLLQERAALPAQVAVETYSVLTRLPTGHRYAPSAARTYLAENFEQRFLVLSPDGYENLLELAAAHGIVGGALYDGLVAATALEHGATLLTLDRRAERVYRLVGVDFRAV